MSEKSLRDIIRSATVGSKKKYRTEIVELDGVKLEVRQLSLSDRREYIEKSIDTQTKQADLLKLQIYAILSSCYVPGTDERVFDETDFNTISNSISGGYADILWEAIQRLSNFTVDEAKKN